MPSATVVPSAGTLDLTSFEESLDDRPMCEDHEDVPATHVLLHPVNPVRHYMCFPCSERASKTVNMHRQMNRIGISEVIYKCKPCKSTFNPEDVTITPIN